jgi:hypothetical protein
VSGTRVQCQRAVDQGQSGVDVLAKVSEDKGSLAEGGWIVGGDLDASAGEIDRCSPVRFAVFNPTGKLELLVAISRQGEGSAITRITRCRFFEEVEGLIDPIFVVGKDIMPGAKVEVVRGEIVCGSARRSRGF